MSEFTTFRCDNCAKLRSNDANHWRELSLRKEPLGPVLTVATFNPADANPDRDHACGEQCTLAMVQRFLATGKLTE